MGAVAWMLNSTGATIPQGSLVAASTAADDDIALTAAGGIGCFGVAESAILNGQYGRVVLAGLVQVLIDNACGRGDWIGISATTAGQGTASPLINTSATVVGQATRIAGGAGLVWCEVDLSGATPLYLRVGQHDTSRAPLGLWQLDSNLLNTGSGAAIDMALGAGTARYVSVLPGSSVHGFYFDGVSYLIHTPHTNVLDLLGEVTIEYVTVIKAKVDCPLIAYGEIGETLNDNYLYSALVSDPALTFNAFWEYGAGTDVNPLSIPAIMGRPTHQAIVRRTGLAGTLDVDFYMDGHLINTVAGNHVPAIGASPTQRLYFGRDPSSSTIVQNVLLASVCLIAGPLTAAQVLVDAKKCLPWLV